MSYNKRTHITLYPINRFLVEFKNEELEAYNIRLNKKRSELNNKLYNVLDVQIESGLDVYTNLGVIHVDLNDLPILDHISEYGESDTIDVICDRLKTLKLTKIQHIKLGLKLILCYKL
jgi:hypothetical protein